MGLGETTRLGEVGRLGDFGERGELGLELPELTFLGFGLPGFLPAFPLGGFVVIFNYKTLCPSPPSPSSFQVFSNPLPPLFPRISLKSHVPITLFLHYLPNYAYLHLVNR